MSTGHQHIYQFLKKLVDGPQVSCHQFVKNYRAKKKRTLVGKLTTGSLKNARGVHSLEYSRTAITN